MSVRNKVTVECSFCVECQLSNDRRIKITVYSFSNYFVLFFFQDISMQ